MYTYIYNIYCCYIFLNIMCIYIYIYIHIYIYTHFWYIADTYFVHCWYMFGTLLFFSYIFVYFCYYPPTRTPHARTTLLFRVGWAAAEVRAGEHSGGDGRGRCFMYFTRKPLVILRNSILDHNKWLIQYLFRISHSIH